MKRSTSRRGFKPAIAVPGALLLVTLLAGVVGFPAYQNAPALGDTSFPVSSFISSAANRPQWEGVPRIDDGRLSAIAGSDAEAEIIPAAAAELDAPVILLPAVLTGRAPLGLQFTTDVLVRSANQQFTLAMQPEGDLMLFDGETPMFSLAGAGADTHVALGTDGNLVQYVGDEVVRETGSAGRGGVALQVTDDGNIVIVDAAGEPVWGLRDVPGSQLFFRALNQVPAHAPEVVWSEFRGPNSTHRILLTFDDCPSNVESFKAAVDFAAESEIGMLLFPTTECVNHFDSQGFDMVGYARERGMYVGNHSISHPQLPKLSDAEIAAEISGLPHTNLVRPPFGAISDRVRAVADSLGIRLVLWDVDTNDWQGKSTQQVIDYVINNAHPGANVLMHMQHKGFNPEALGAIKQGLAARGLELCPPALGATDEVAPAELCM